MNKLGIYQDCPFVFGQLPTLGANRTHETPQLVIEPEAITIELGDTALRLIKSPTAHEQIELETGRWAGIQRGLGTVPAHSDAGQGLRRYEFDGAPYHSALHIVDDAAATTPDYCSVHVHDDVAELNVIVPNAAGEGLSYDITDGSATEEVQEPTVLWFPPGVKHCATAAMGGGLFFVARLPVAAESTTSVAG